MLPLQNESKLLIYNEHGDELWLEFLALFKRVFLFSH